MSWMKKIFTRGNSGKSDKLMNETEFADYYCAQLSQALATPVHLDKSDQDFDNARFVLTIEGTEMAMSFANRYALYRAQPDALAQNLQQDLQAIHETSRQINQAQPDWHAGQIFPVIKHRHWAEANGDIPSADDDQRDNIVIPLAGDLILTYAVDGEHSLTYLKYKALPELGFADLKALHNKALENFAAYANANMRTEQDENGILHCHLDGIYEASLCLFARDIIAQLPELFPSQAVFALPARDCFMICDSEHARALPALVEQTQHLVRQLPNSISEHLYYYDAEGEMDVYLGFSNN